MTRTIAGAAFGLLLVCSGHSAMADSQRQTVQDLYEWCKLDIGNLSTEEDLATVPMRHGFCLGYLKGIADTQSAVGGPNYHLKGADLTKLLKVLAICDTTYSAASLRQAFLNWVEANPKFWRMSAGFGAATAFNQIWPCK